MKPPTPILSVFLYVIAVVELIVGAFVTVTALSAIGEKGQAAYGMSIAALSAVATVVTALALCGIAQAINYLSASAFYSHRIYDLLETHAPRTRGQGPRASEPYPIKI
jgi:hypothetical protein